MWRLVWGASLFSRQAGWERQRVMQTMKKQQQQPPWQCRSHSLPGQSRGQCEDPTLGRTTLLHSRKSTNSRHHPPAARQQAS